MGLPAESITKVQKAYAGLLRPFGEEVGPMVQKATQCSYRHSQWPQQWKGGLAARIPEKTGATPGDNRCITVFNVMSRVAQKHQIQQRGPRWHPIPFISPQAVDHTG